MPDLVVIAHDIRSTYNVGSLIRTSEALGVSKVYLTGYTPYPLQTNDTRLPHMSQKTTRQIDKTALGTQDIIDCQYTEDVVRLISSLKSQDYLVIGLEQAENSVNISDIQNYLRSDKIALLLGREVEGIESGLLKLCDLILEIPLKGTKESLNVIQAAAIAIYKLNYETM